MNVKPTYKRIHKDFRLSVAPLTEEEKELILSAKRKLGMTKPHFYKKAILDHARSVMAEEESV